METGDLSILNGVNLSQFRRGEDFVWEGENSVWKLIIMGIEWEGYHTRTREDLIYRFE